MDPAQAGMQPDSSVHAPRPGTVGHRIAPSWPRCDPAVVRGLAILPTGVIGDAMHRLGTMRATIRALWPGARLAGTVLPVTVRSGDNTKVHEALALARPGDCLVVNGHGSIAHALFGELMATQARAHRVVGIVVDGAVRDLQSLQAMAFPAFGLGSCPGGPTKLGFGEVGYPVACGGVVCAAGDVVVADTDGVVVVPQADASSVLDHARAVQAWEKQRHADLGG